LKKKKGGEKNEGGGKGGRGEEHSREFHG